jgi:hypothetical protein
MDLTQHIMKILEELGSDVVLSFCLDSKLHNSLAIKATKHTANNSVIFIERFVSPTVVTSSEYDVVSRVITKQIIPAMLTEQPNA